MSASSIGRDLRWWAEDYAYALWWQAKALRVGQPGAYLSGELRPVVILPGVWESWAFMMPVIVALHAAGHPVYVLSDLGRNSKSVVDTAATVAEYLRTHDLRDVVFVAHSKGGLIGKYVMAFLDDEKRVTSMIAVCAPFSGSRYAPYLVLPSLRAFSPRDATTVLLGADTTANARILSIFSEFDPHIPEGSELAGAVNIRLPLGGHFQILSDPTALGLVLEAASNPQGIAALDRADGLARYATLQGRGKTIERQYASIRRLLFATLVVDGSNVAALSFITLASTRATEMAIALGYIVVGLVGFGLAARAVFSFHRTLPPSEDLARTVSFARRLVMSGLLINTIGCALLLALQSTAVNQAAGSYLLIGGDLISVVYLAGIAGLKRRVMDTRT
jgi:triacylglycerol lipase